MKPAKAALGRPKDLQKREAILHAARKLFLDRGFEATTLEGIAAQAGVSRMTVYGHFDDKITLFANVISHESKSLVTALDNFGVTDGDSGIESADDLRSELLQFGFDLITFLSQPERRAFNRLIDAESRRHPQLSETFKNSGPRPVVRQLSQRMASAIKSNVIDVAEPLKAACHLISLFKGIELASAYTPRPNSPEIAIRTHVNDCVTLFLDGCVVRSL